MNGVNRQPFLLCFHLPSWRWISSTVCVGSCCDGLLFSWVVHLFVVRPGCGFGGGGISPVEERVRLPELVRT